MPANWHRFLGSKFKHLSYKFTLVQGPSSLVDPTDFTAEVFQGCFSGLSVLKLIFFQSKTANNT